MIALVPARGGSKGLPGKNLRPLAGRPLIVHTLEAALAAGTIERVVVSTDDDEIIRVARGVPGVEVPFRRPPQLAGDDASAIDAYLHAVDCLELLDGAAPSALCVLLPTAPLRGAADIDAAVTLFRHRRAEVVLSVAPAKPLAWHQHMAADGRLAPATGRASVANRQDCPQSWLPNGAIYVLDMAALRRTRTYFGPATWGLPMPAERSVDIDTETDFLLAETLLARRVEHDADSLLRIAV
ncbi:MAG: acylneuraminate cytidylyltransferase family protein [Alphaproteobacteria bacterium]